MATITLRYDARNAIAKKNNRLYSFFGGFRKKTELDEAIEDAKAGRVYQAKNAKDLINQCTSDFF